MNTRQVAPTTTVLDAWAIVRRDNIDDIEYAYLVAEQGGETTCWQASTTGGLVYRYKLRDPGKVLFSWPDRPAENVVRAYLKKLSTT